MGLPRPQMAPRSCSKPTALRNQRSKEERIRPCEDAGTRGGACRKEAPQEREEALAERRHLRALEVDMAIERHQQLHGLQLPAVRRKRTALVNKLVGKVFDSVPKNFQRMTGLRVDAPPPICTRADGFSGWRRHCYREAGRRGSCHGVYPHLVCRPGWHFFQMTNVPFPVKTR